MRNILLASLLFSSLLYLTVNGAPTGSNGQSAPEPPKDTPEQVAAALVKKVQAFGEQNGASDELVLASVVVKDLSGIMSELATPSTSAQVVQPLPAQPPLSLDAASSQLTPAHLRKHSVNGHPDRPSSSDSLTATPSLSSDDSGHHGHLSEQEQQRDRDQQQIRDREQLLRDIRDRKFKDGDKLRDADESRRSTNKEADEARRTERTERGDDTSHSGSDVHRRHEHEDRASEQEQQRDRDQQQIRDREQLLRDIREHKFKDGDKARDADESRRSTTKEADEARRTERTERGDDTPHSGSDAHRRHDHGRGNPILSTDSAGTPSTLKTSASTATTAPVPKVQQQAPAPPPQPIAPAPVAANPFVYTVGGAAANARRAQMFGPYQTA